MEYIFGTNDFTGEEVLKTVGAEHSGLSGFQQTVREYPDCTITDSFFVVRKTKSAEDEEGKCYDWYLIDQHNRYVDKSVALKQAQEDADAMAIDHEYRLTLLELGVTE